MDSGKEEDDVFQKAIKEKIKMQKDTSRKVCLIGVNNLYMQVQKYKKEYNVEYVNKIRNQRDRTYFEMYKAIAEIVNEDDNDNENKTGDNTSSSNDVSSTISTPTTTKNKNKKKDNFYVTSLINTKYFSIDRTENIFF